MSTARATRASTRAAVRLEPIEVLPQLVDVYVYRGDTFRVRVTCTDPGGAPMDVTAATWDCDIRVTVDDPVVLATLAVEPVDGDTASVDVVLDPADSAMLPEEAVWDLEMTLGGVVQTLFNGKWTTTPDVSRVG